MRENYEIEDSRTTAALISSFSWKSVTKPFLEAEGVPPSIRMQRTFFFWKVGWKSSQGWIYLEKIPQKLRSLTIKNWWIESSMGWWCANIRNLQPACNIHSSYKIVRTWKDYYMKTKSMTRCEILRILLLNPQLKKICQDLKANKESYE